MVLANIEAAIFIICLIFVGLIRPSLGAGPVCPPDPQPDDDCIKVRKIKDFRSIVANAADGDHIVFCPFNLEKRGGAAKPTARAHFACLIPGKCVLDGRGTHIQIGNAGGSPETIWQGFTFKGATLGAVKVFPDTKERQMFCNCAFEDNVREDNLIGAGLKTGTDTLVTVRSCTFQGNEALGNMGGAIDNRGHLEVYESVFTNNKAENGAAIYTKMGAYLEIVGNDFIGNVATRNDGPVILGFGFGRSEYLDGGGNTSKGNRGNCLGFWNKRRDECKVFESNMPAEVSEKPAVSPSEVPMKFPTETPPTAVPLKSPSKFPTVQPLAAPSKTPTKKPTHAPISAPTRSPTEMPIDTNEDYTVLGPGDEDIDPVSNRMYRGYYNYILNDKRYGPLRGWSRVDVRDNEWIPLNKMLGDFDASVNQCGNNPETQSPFDLGPATTECEGIHQIRTGRGPWRILTLNNQIQFNILRDRLRIEFEVDWGSHEDNVGPYMDGPNRSPQQYAKYVEIMIPSGHTRYGKRYDGEYIVAHVYKNKGISMVSSLMDASANRHNEQLQVLLDAWQQLKSGGFEECGSNSGRRTLLSDLRSRNVNSTQTPGRYLHVDEYDRIEEFKPHSERRNLKPIATSDPRFNIYHLDLMPSEWFHVYDGSTMTPPCVPAKWYVMDRNMQISRAQIKQIKDLLTDGPCKGHEGRIGLGEIMARPLQQKLYNVRKVMHCTEQHWASDCRRFGGQQCPGPDWEGPEPDPDCNTEKSNCMP